MQCYIHINKDVGIAAGVFIYLIRKIQASIRYWLSSSYLFKFHFKYLTVFPYYPKQALLITQACTQRISAFYSQLLRSRDKLAFYPLFTCFPMCLRCRSCGLKGYDYFQPINSSSSIFATSSISSFVLKYPNEKRIVPVFTVPNASCAAGAQ